MPRKASATETRTRLGELVRWIVAEQEPVIVEHRGKPRVVMLSVEDYQRMGGRIEEPEDWWELVERTRELIARERGGRPMPDVTELIHEMREERDRQLMEAIGFPLDPSDPSHSSS